MARPARLSLAHGSQPLEPGSSRSDLEASPTHAVQQPLEQDCTCPSHSPLRSTSEWLLQRLVKSRRHPQPPEDARKLKLLLSFQVVQPKPPSLSVRLLHSLRVSHLILHLEPHPIPPQIPAESPFKPVGRRKSPFLEGNFAGSRYSTPPLDTPELEIEPRKEQGDIQMCVRALRAL